LSDPQWYKNLSPIGREAVDQTLHLICGFSLSALSGAYSSAVVLYIREFWLQWPVERVADTRKDMAFWLAGMGLFEIWRYFR
jgi:hypothetical protein